MFNVFSYNFVRVDAYNGLVGWSLVFGLTAL